MTTFLEKNLRAFTFVEVVVVMAIISIVFGMVIVSLTNSRVKRELETNAREFAGVVRQAQNYALTGKQILEGTNPCQFQVDWNGSGYTLIYHYKDSNGNCNQTSTMAVYPLKNGVTFTGSGSLSFTLPHAVSGSTSLQFIKNGINHTVCISSDGRVSDHPGGAACPSS